MNRRTVAIITFLIRLPRRKMERAGDLFIKENIAHRIHYERIYSKRKLADVPRAPVGIKNLVEPFGVVAGGVDHFSVLQFQLHLT